MERYHTADTVTFVAVEGAAHHVFLDKPLETVHHVRRVLSHWESGAAIGAAAKL